LILSRSQVVASGAFDDITSRDIRFFEKAAELGELTVLLWPDAVIKEVAGEPPQFSLAERSYFLNAVRYISKVVEADASAKKPRGRCLGRLSTNGKSCA
jgi:glycerol-3-phosphate cytidylyltransferase-like family protein